MKDFIKEIVANAEVSTSFIGEARDIVDTYFDMINDGFNFFEETTIKEVLDMLEENDILAITKSIDEDYVEYFIEEVFDEQGETLLDDITEELYIDEELMDCIELDKYPNAEVYSFYIDEDEESDDVIDDILNDLIEDIQEFSDEEDFCPICLIEQALQNSFDEGYEQALEDLGI